MPVFEVGDCINNLNAITILIPDMNFTHPANIAGFIVAGRIFTRQPSSKIQIWQQNSSQPGIYYQVKPDIILNRDMICTVNTEILACRKFGDSV